MVFRRPGSAGLAVLSFALMLVPGSGNAVRGVHHSTISDDGSSIIGCIPRLFGDGDCDLENDNEDCGYDGGDCCECTCVSTSHYTCGENGGYFCLDPAAACVDDDDVTALSTAAAPCIREFSADGDCDGVNNNEACGYDGGDCCECTCVSTAGYSCGATNGFNCIDSYSPCVNGFVEVGTKTTVRVSANAYDTRPGKHKGHHGCMDGGCVPELTRDGITAVEAESRWSCKSKLVPHGLPCAIEFTFEDPQDLTHVEVAFFKGDQRSRTVKISINDEEGTLCDSYPGSTFNTFGIKAGAVHTLRIESVGLGEEEWLSFLEVRFLVEP